MNRIQRLYLPTNTPGGRETKPLSHPLVAAGLTAVLAVFATTVAEAADAPGENGTLTALITVLIIALVIAGAAIASLVVWGRKHEHISDMLVFCMKFLLQSKDEEERCSSARALGSVSDPGALLVLLDVVWDEGETDKVRKAAGDALHEMGVKSRKYQGIIQNLEAETEKGNAKGVIELLTTNFEGGRRSHVQSACIIGRLYMQLGDYAEAREWLRKAAARNEKNNLYGPRIGGWIEKCNNRLLEDADNAFKYTEYQQARERYAALDHGLSEDDRQRFAIYLRSACVYCKLKEYESADEALLAALRHEEETDTTLTLVPLLQAVLRKGEEQAASDPELEETRKMIDERAGSIMSTLLERNVWNHAR